MTDDEVDALDVSWGIPEEGTKRRGRPLAIDDQAIFARREAFANALSSLWGEVAWNLRRCKTVDDVAEALLPLRKVAFLCQIVSIFFEKRSGPPASIEEIRTVRIEIGNISRSLDVINSDLQRTASFKDVESISLKPSPSMRFVSLSRKQLRHTGPLGVTCRFSFREKSCLAFPMGGKRSAREYRH